MADNRGRRSPDEIARAKAVAAQVMEKQKKTDGLSDIKKGRAFIFVVAVLFLLGFIRDYVQFEAIELLYFYGPLIVLYFALGIYYYRNPFVIAIVALSIYLAIILISALIEPTSILSGIIIKIIIITALSGAIRNGKLYNDEFKQKEKSSNDILDDELLG